MNIQEGKLVQHTESSDAIVGSRPLSDVNHHPRHGEVKSVKEALLVRLEAKPGKERELESFLAEALAMANEESTTPMWLALRLSPTTFGIFDAFVDESGRQAHLNGPIARALMEHAVELLASAPNIEVLDVLGMKNRLAMM